MSRVITLPRRMTSRRSPRGSQECRLIDEHTPVAGAERRENPLFDFFGTLERHQPGDRLSVHADDDGSAGGRDLIDEGKALLLEFSGANRLSRYVHGRAPWTKTPSRSRSRTGWVGMRNMANTATAMDKIRPLRSHTQCAPWAPGQAAALIGPMRAPASISPSNRSNRSASVSVTECGKRPALKKLLGNRAQGLTHFFAIVAGPWCASEPCNGLRATVDRPRAVTGAIVSRLGAAGARSRTCDNLLSLNQ